MKLPCAALTVLSLLAALYNLQNDDTHSLLHDCLVCMFYLWLTSSQNRWLFCICSSQSKSQNWQAFFTVFFCLYSIPADMLCYPLLFWINLIFWVALGAYFYQQNPSMSKTSHSHSTACVPFLIQQLHIVRWSVMFCQYTSGCWILLHAWANKTIVRCLTCYNFLLSIYCSEHILYLHLLHNTCYLKSLSPAC
jgi:hypothetical protein